jgi:hypothetical protein
MKVSNWRVKSAPRCAALPICGSASWSIQASTDLNAWNTVADDVTGADGLLSRTLEVGAVSQTMFLRVASLP